MQRGYTRCSRVDSLDLGRRRYVFSLLRRLSEPRPLSRVFGVTLFCYIYFKINEYIIPFIFPYWHQASVKRKLGYFLSEKLK